MTTNGPRSTSLLLIILTFITGVAFGWMLCDFFLPQAAADNALPTATILPAVAQQPIQTAQPGSTPSMMPPSPTAQPVTLTATALPPTATATALPPTATATALPPTATATALPPTATATALPPTATVTALPPTVAVQLDAGYLAHQVAPGESLADIAAQAGSDATLIATYNHLSSEPQVGRLLIVPRVAGQPSSLPNKPVQVLRGSNEKARVALTLDAGASAAPTTRMLNTLRERGIRITFFLTGTWIRENPELVRQMLADGHEISNHTLNHPDLRKLSEQQIIDQLSETELALREVANSASIRPFFRLPYGAYNDRVLQIVQSQGYLSIYWTLDSLDSVGEPKSAEFLLERVTRKLSPEQLRGAIILAHCGSEATADALPAILDRYAEMGFEVTTVSRVLEP